MIPNLDQNSIEPIIIVLSNQTPPNQYAHVENQIKSICLRQKPKQNQFVDGSYDLSLS